MRIQKDNATGRYGYKIYLPKTHYFTQSPYCYLNFVAALAAVKADIVGHGQIYGRDKNAIPQQPEY